ncbi:MAG: hypothetical protein ACLQMH_12510 [Solirubrobacteraceae bacterium]
MTAADQLAAMLVDLADRAQAARTEAVYRRMLRAARRSQVKCAGCGATFTPRRSNQRYHSLACKQKAYRWRSA